DAARLAAGFVDLGLGPDSKIALYLYNGPEYLVSQFAGFKVRGVPINVNYRYLDDELLYLLDNSDAEVIVFHTSLGDRVERVREKLPNLRAVISVDDGGPTIDGALALHDIVRDHEPMERIDRSPDDVYMLYTGGTTGMPKGVMYRQEDFSRGITTNAYLLVGGTPGSIEDVPDAVARYDEVLPHRVFVSACPFMHGTGMWLGAISPHCTGAATVTLENRSFDAHELWQVIERER